MWFTLFQPAAVWRIADEPWSRETQTKEWTDHNAHDPGVTTVETLGFALTDFDL